MTFRGFSPLTGPARWGLAAVALGIVLGATSPSALHGLAAAWDHDRSILPWVFERLFAFLAYLAMAGSVVYGLLLSTKLLDAIAHRPISFALHQDLAAIGLGLAGIHGALLGLDATVPFTVAQIAVPGLAPYAPVAVGVGQVALYLSAAVVGSFYLRRRIGQRAWRLLHYLTFLAFLGATVHGIAAGTDGGTAWARWLYLGATTVVVFLLVYRIATAVAASRQRTPARTATRVAAGPAPAMARSTTAGSLPARPGERRIA